MSWMAMLLVCSNPWANSCTVMAQSKELQPTKEICFKVSQDKAKVALSDPNVHWVVPMCIDIKTHEEI